MSKKKKSKNELSGVFTAFASFGKGSKQKLMGSSNWKKFCVETELIDDKFTKNDIALVFAGSKTKGKNDIDIKQFKVALGKVGVKKFPSDPAKDSLATVIGLVKDRRPGMTGTTKGKVASSLEEKTGSVKDKSKEEVAGVTGSKELNAVFTDFASFGQGSTSKRMTQSNWKKLCEDAKLIDEKFEANDVAIVFSAVKAKGKNDISYGEFRKALGRVAKKKGESADEVAEACSGVKPTTEGTTKGKIKDSLEEKTGVYARGGGSNKDADKDLSALANRGVKTDARGVPISKEHM